MSGFWPKIREIITKFLNWAIENHPGKLIGTSLGLVLGLFMVTLGLWRTLILALFAILGFVLGKLQDDDKSITTWLDKNFRKY